VGHKKNDLKQAFFNWSGGKDSAMALHQMIQLKDYKIAALLTNISRDIERISMHGVRKSLLLKQVASLKLNVPLHLLELWEGMSMDDYSAIMETQLNKFAAQNIQTAIFGDIFLEDLRAYREQKLESVGMSGHFPLWGQGSKELVQRFINLCFKAIIVCTNARLLDESFVGRIIDQGFLKDLPEEVDPCGENGEYHSFVFDGPIFKEPIPFEIGEKVLKKYKDADGEWDSAFWYIDLI